MNHTQPPWKFFALILLCAAPRLPAQELTFLSGVMTPSNLKEWSYNWQIDYRQDFARYLSGSISYINEGHVKGHHRDGSAWEMWAQFPLAHDRLTFSLGAGAYYFYDTQPLPNGDTANIHGTAPIASFSLTGYLDNRWFARLMLNRINPAKEPKVNTAALGVGYWFGREKKPTPGKLGSAPEEKPYLTENEATLFVGQSVVNTFFSEDARAIAGEFRRGVLPHLDWTASAIYEGDPKIIRRSGLATQLWPVNTFLNHRIAVGIGIGPYIYLDHKHPLKRANRNPAALAPLASLTFSVRLSEHWLTRVIWDRVTSNYNRDADIFLVGLGYRWPH